LTASKRQVEISVRTPASERSDPVPGPARARPISQVHPGEFEVVWPLNRWHYLFVPDPDVPVDPPALASTWAAQSSPRSVSGPVASAPFPIGGSTGNGHDQPDASGLDPTHQPGRALAVHAFLHGATCRDRRVSALLGVSARTIGRDRAQPLLMAPSHLARAQTLIAASADRGSTPEEREAAAAWLRTPLAHPKVQPAAAKRVSLSAVGNGSRLNHCCLRETGRLAVTSVARPATARTATAPRHPRSSHRPRRSLKMKAQFRFHVDTLRRQQQRILHHSALIDYVLKTENRTGA
jgi:hypothetical protein